MINYNPLNPTNSEIRLVTLHPGRATDDIHCTLKTASLDECPKYEALSYTWGDENDTKPVTVNACLHDATSNLETALRCLRRRWKPRIMWVDALCINQTDVDEKNTQLGFP